VRGDFPVELILLIKELTCLGEAQVTMQIINHFYLFLYKHQNGFSPKNMSETID